MPETIASQPPAPLTVTELTARIKERLERDFVRVEVTGEVSRLTRPSSGHLYFTIKDQYAAISAVIWRSAALRLKTQPQEGGEFIFSGHLSVYEPRGSYQLVVTRVEESGAGQLAAEFERRKLLFAERGWFAPEHKQPIPQLPRHIGIVTSPTAAAFEDVKKVLATRPGWLTLTLSPCLVQGNEAPATIAAALQRLTVMPDKPDLILLVRGGGSIEDLWGFNDEQVVRAIVECPIPVISGIGHEIDVTLADFAADVRAATPSNAAEMASPSCEELRRHLPRLPLLQGLLLQRLQHERRRCSTLEEALQHRWQRQQDTRHLHVERKEKQLEEGQRARLQRMMQLLRQQQRRLAQQEPGYRLRQRHHALNQLIRRLEDASHRVTTKGEQRHGTMQQRLHASLPRLLERKQGVQRLLGGRLQALSPQRVLERGYTLPRDADGNLITSARTLAAGSRLDIRFHDGRADAEVKQVHTGEKS